MKLPNPDRAIVELDKLRRYCLSRTHPRGRHKARVFATALGITEEHVELLRAALLAAVASAEATPGEGDRYGQRYVLDFEMSGPSGKATVRSLWIVLDGQDFPRLTSCYVS